MSETMQMQVAAEVRAWLGRRNITARQAALELGWSDPSYLYRRLRSEYSFSIDDLEALAALLKISITDFIPQRIVQEVNVSRAGDVNKHYLSPASPRAAAASFIRVA